MKFGMRTPSLKKRFSSRTTRRITRSIKKATNPLYGKKGIGAITNPKKAIYNKVYNKITFSNANISKGKNTKKVANKVNTIKYNTKAENNDIIQKQIYTKEKKVKYFDKLAHCCICNKDLGLFTLRNRIQLYDGWLCWDCYKKLESFNLNIRKKYTTNYIIKTYNEQLEKEKEETEQFKRKRKELKLWEENNKKYEKCTSEMLKIDKIIWNEKLYSKAINQTNINNEYADRYIDLCNRLLQLLPYNLEHSKKDAEIRHEEYHVPGLGNNLINFIRLLEKQEKYNELINVCSYLLKLGFTSDNTKKKGIKGRIEEAITNFNIQNNTNYSYYPNDNVIIDNNTGKIIECLK